MYRDLSPRVLNFYSKEKFKTFFILKLFRFLSALEIRTRSRTAWIEIVPEPVRHTVQI